MLRNLINATETMNNVIDDVIYSSAYDMLDISTLSVQAVNNIFDATVVVPSAAIDPATDTFTLANHGLVTGVEGQFTTSGGLPTGLALSTNYWIIKVTDSTFKVATSLVNAQAGTAINVTTAGTGNQTFTPTSIASGALSFQRSNVTVNSFAPTDPADWDDIDNPVDVVSDGNVWYTKVGPEWRWFRVSSTTSAGSLQTILHVLGRGYNKH